MSKHLLPFHVEVDADNVRGVRIILSNPLDENTPITGALGTVATVSAEPQQPVAGAGPLPDFTPPLANGEQGWAFLLSLTLPAGVERPIAVIANFAKGEHKFTESQARSHEMNVGAAAFNHNIAYRIVESTGVWDRLRGNVKWRFGDKLEGVISFPANVTLDMAKQMLRGRVKRMEREPNSRHFMWLDSKDLKAGA